LRSSIALSPLGQRFQLDGGLRLVTDPVSDAEQRRHRVEQPAHARAGDCAGTGRQLRTDRGPLARSTSRDRREVVAPRHAGCGQKGQGHPARIADGGVAAGQVDGREVSGAPVAGRIRSEQQELPAPDRAVVAVTGAVERDADDRLADPAVLGQQ
jgi:hypothetical protein